MTDHATTTHARPRRKAVYDFTKIVHCHQPASTSTSPGCAGQGRCSCECGGCNGRTWVDDEPTEPCPHCGTALAKALPAGSGRMSLRCPRCGGITREGPITSQNTTTEPR